jgi:transcriptional regulator with XRE-family HTH domain
MRSTLAQAIRNARLACGLTQDQLGMRLGLRGRAVYRWERDDSIPSKRHRRALVTAVNAVNQPAAAALHAVLESVGKGAPVVPAPAPVPPPGVNAKLVLDLAVFSLAEELDLPARRARGALARLLARLREASVTIEAAERELAERSNRELAG